MSTVVEGRKANPLPIHSFETAPKAAHPVLQKAKETLGFVPNLYGMLSSNPEALSAYVGLGKAVENSGLTPIEQQVVLLTVSIENQCEYCVAAHSAIAGMIKVPESIVNSLRNRKPIDDTRLESLRLFTSKLVSRRGHLDSNEVSRFLVAGYDSAAILAVITAVALKTISNYANHIAETPLDKAFQPHVWKA